jgi:type I site-specific restriction-modification system R (restriction) subunit
MDQATHNKIVSFIWGIADDVLRDLFKRGKYPDVILPMFVLRRLDAVLEPTKKAVLETKEMLDTAGITEQRAALAAAAGQSFYNTSRFTLRNLKSRGSQQQLLADFEDYLNGFSPNVQDILENSKFRNQLSTLSKSDSLSTLINKFLDPEINLSPDPVLNADRTVRHPGMDNHSMGTVFEELVRKFNEENNEEAGEHWTPRDAVRLMAMLIFLPIADASYRVEKRAAMKLALADDNAEIGPIPVEGGGHKPQPELDRLSNILKAFNDHFGTLFADADRVSRRITEDIAPKVAADPAYQNAKKNTPHTARMAHDMVLGKVMQILLKDDTQVYKQFVENESFRRFVTDMVFTLTTDLAA